MSSQRILEKWKLWFKNQNLICNKLESWRHIEIIFHFLVSNHENLTKATKIWHEKLFFLCSNLSNSIWNTNYTVWSRFETAKCHSTSCSSLKGKQLLSWCWIPDLEVRGPIYHICYKWLKTNVVHLLLPYRAPLVTTIIMKSSHRTLYLYSLKLSKLWWGADPQNIWNSPQPPIYKLQTTSSCKSEHGWLCCKPFSEILTTDLIYGKFSLKCTTSSALSFYWLLKG